ncbi:hypothetical protein FB45DRAFT_754866 [Roridomyces roridus]|uniref:Uncharacterized protein n=1 Tax=Roridomyces roridus TaxID=1738132 RepID=A0AAD7BG31_9AGAR|nr:hypothetical protein FB45DRAFT_754866 [Roridomyces roridus]
MPAPKAQTPPCHLFFPSALYTHYNSKLKTERAVRGSVAAWTGAALFQYVDLGCRSVKQLSDDVKVAYKTGLKERMLERFEMFPHAVSN